MSTTTRSTKNAATETGQGASVIVRAGAISDILTAVTLVSNNKESQAVPVLQSGHFEIRDGGLTVSATDRYRVLQAQTEGPVEGEASGIVPHAFLDRVKKVMGKVKVADETDLVTVTLSGEEITIDWSGQTLVGELIDGNYPKVDSFIRSDTREEIGRVGLNPGFLQDLTKMGFPRTVPLVMEFSGENRPIHTQWETRRADAAKVSFHHVLMPVKVRD